MKKLTKTVVSLALVVVMLVCFCGTALATYNYQWATFPTQSKLGYTNYTYGIQAILNCYSEGTFKTLGGVDGIFGDNTESAVEIYQANEYIGVDGIVGSETWQKLWSELTYRSALNGYENYYLSNGYSTINAISKGTGAVQGATLTYWYALIGGKLRVQFGVY